LQIATTKLTKATKIAEFKNLKGLLFETPSS